MAQSTHSGTAQNAHVTMNTLFAHSAKQDAVSDAFKLHQAKFGQLGSEQDFQHLQSQLIEIDISQALSHLSEEHYLEITMPTTGLTDFLSQDASWQAMGQQFGTILAINGFGGGSGEGVYPKPHYILAEDIIGNTYELLVEPDGTIQGPEEGIGLFSLIKSFTFMYSAEQILNGEHLANIQEAGAKAGFLYMLAPIDVETQYQPKIKVSHLDDYLNNQVDFEMDVPILLQSVDSPADKNLEIQAEKLDTDFGQFLHLELSGQQFGNTLHQPFDLKLNIGSLSNVEYSAPDANLSHQLPHNIGWVQSLDNPNEFTKAYGLSEYGLTALARNLFSEFDLTTSLLQGESLGLSQENHYNDFMLSKEAIGVFYDLMLNDIVDHKLPIDTVLSLVPDERMAALDLSYAEFDTHDAQVIDTLSEQVAQFQFDGLKALYNSDVSGQTQEFFDDMFVQVEGELSALPQVDVSVIDPYTSDSSIMLDNPLDFSLPDLAAPMEFALAGNGFDGSSMSEDAIGTDYAPLSFHDVIEAGGLNSDLTQNSETLELNALLATLGGPQEGVSQVDYHGHDLHLSLSPTQSAEPNMSPTMTSISPLGDDFSGNFSPDI